MELFKDINSFLEKAAVSMPSPERLLQLDKLTAFIVKQHRSDQTARLNFICTHNSRRSQLSQVWSHCIAQKLELDIESHSGGTEVTAFAKPAIQTLRATGFEIHIGEDKANSIYMVKAGPNDDGIPCFSKLFDAELQAGDDFAAIMTCSSADENCPFIPGASARIPIQYEDPKQADGTALQEESYRQCSFQIAAELFYAFNQVRSQI